MKRSGNLWPQLTSWENLLASALAAARGKRKRPDVARFLFNLEPNLCSLQRELLAGVWVPGEYRTFWIRDPKPRMISAARHAPNFVEPLRGEFVAADVQKPEVFGKPHQVTRPVHVPDRGGQRAAVLRLISRVDKIHQQIQRRRYQILAHGEPVGLRKLLHLGENPQVPVVSFLNYYRRFGHLPSPPKNISPKGACPLWNPPLNAKH